MTHPKRAGSTAARMKKRNETKMILRQPVLLISIVATIALLLLFVIYPLVKVLIFGLTDENGRLYVWPSGTMPSEGLILDNSTAELMSRIPDMLCVNLKTNRIYRDNGAESNIAIYPIYSFDQLLEKAKKLMD